MKIAKVLIASLMVILPLMAQKEKTEESKRAEALPSDWPVKMFQVKYADVNRLANLFRAFGATVQPDSDLRALSVRAPKEVLAAIEESLQRLDVPQPPAKNIQIDTYLLIASAQGSPGTTPADLEPVLKQLKNIFNYQAFRLLGTLTMRVRDDSDGTVSGLLPPVSADADAPTSYRFHINKVAITSEGKERAVRINQLELRMGYALKGPPHHGEAQIYTSVDVHEGQKVVVGKANIDNADGALILVLTGKVME